MGNEVGELDYEELSDDLVQNMPEVSEHVIEEETGKVDTHLPAKPAEPAAGQQDAFDPAIHCTDKDGNPVMTKAGTFRKRPGRGRGDTAKQGTLSGKVGQGGNVNANLAEKPQLSREELAKMAAEKFDFLYWSGMSLALPCRMLQPLQQQVSPMAVEALTEGMAEAEEIPNIPWYVMAGMIYLSSTMALLNAEENKPRVLSIKDRIILFFAKRRKGQAERQK